MGYDITIGTERGDVIYFRDRDVCEWKCNKIPEEAPDDLM